LPHSDYFAKDRIVAVNARLKEKTVQDYVKNNRQGAKNISKILSRPGSGFDVPKEPVNAVQWIFTHATHAQVIQNLKNLQL